MTSGQLYERDAELALIHSAVGQAAQGAGTLLVVDGHAGTGKTALVEAARSAAMDAGLLTLRARGSELEREFVFGVTRQLFEGVLPVVSQEADDPFSGRHALYRLVSDLAAERPLALVVDDAHWADPASLGVLAHLANRIADIPLTLVVAARAEESSPELDALRLRAEEHLTLLRPSPLGRTSTALVVRSFAPAADDALCRACHTATGGNPFLLTELARSLPADARGPADAGRFTERSPQRVTQEVASRLARLPGSAIRIAQGAAVLGGRVTLRHAAALADASVDDAAVATEALVAAGVLRAGMPIDFVHPLVRTAVYAGIAPAARSAAHERAAQALADEGAAPDRLAPHLLRSQPAGDRWAHDQLVAAARIVAARGEWQAATDYLRRALAEPAPPELRTDLWIELGAAESRSSDPAAAIPRLHAALAADLDANQRSRATMLLAGVLGQTGRAGDAVELLKQQPDAPPAAGAEAALADAARVDPIARPRVAGVLARLRRDVDEGDVADPVVLDVVAAEIAMAGEPADATARVAERALAGFDTAAPGRSAQNAIRALVAAERYDTALGALERAAEVAHERGGPFDVGAVHASRCELHLHTGDLAAAEVDARTVRAAASSSDWPAGAAWAAALRCELLVERGELDDAEALFADGAFAAPATDLPRVESIPALLIARARLRRAQGRAADAVDDLREAGRRAAETGQVNPALLPWRSELAHALINIGDGAEAEAAELATDELERARAFGAPRAVAVALRAAARVHGRRAAVALLREAVDVLGEEPPARLVLARVLTDLGTALRANGDPEAARPPLRVAVETAHRCDARALEEQALAELRASGARPRRAMLTGAGALTRSERKIAELAAAGRMNREIATDLFVTMHTVEFHLRNAYRKLAITSRTQLAEALWPQPAAPLPAAELAMAA